jgi:glycerophosphoryl diester phosphodiesterase
MSGGRPAGRHLGDTTRSRGHVTVVRVRSVLCVAHRGSSGAAPENTLAAFRLAVEQGSDLIETDVHRTADGALVCLHDATLARTTDATSVFPDRAPWRVGDLTLAEVRQLDAGAWRGSPGERVPTLEELLDLVDGTGVGLLLELKSPGDHPGMELDCARVLADLAPSGWGRGAAPARGPVAVQSFDWAAMWRHRRALPSVPVGLLGLPPIPDLPELSLWAAQVNPPHERLDAAWVARAQGLDLDVLTWTVDEVAEMEAALDRGVDGVITNRPDVLAGLLDERRVRTA